MPSITAAGGAAPAVIMSTGRGNLLVAGVEQHVHHHRRAAQMGDAVALDRLVDRRRPRPGAGRHACPASAVTVHGKHQPLQWNIGNVQR